ncbi:cathepsin O-like isoform X2 [Cephus cinctus]|uniref:Cathepsin O-like isoform X2 n=1 Tax=Cephus cinctus TaxID=211228 RepID=A0AAJ7C7Q7_CEPCN|nr:cathepsin O-like isoform X2 [Cephus cinctus]
MEWKTIVIAVLVVSLCFLAIPFKVQPSETKEDVKLFEEYVTKHNKSYRRDVHEYDKRFKSFQTSLRHIERMNGLRTSKESAYYGLTEFSDMSPEEFLQVSLRERKMASKNSSEVYERRKRGVSNLLVGTGAKGTKELPLKFDWREKGAVGPIRSQGNCGACWAFSTVQVVESMAAIANGTLPSLSVQEMIDCARNNNFGCEGGDICSLLGWLLATKMKILPETSYPLTRKTDVCKIDKSNKATPGFRITDYTCDSFVDNEQKLLAAIAYHGPVAVAVNALTWQNYLGGIIQYHCDGSFVSLNHAVQIVGYDNTAAIPYYIVKNSWGPSFGNKGYVYIAIGSNLCGIANQVSSIDIS